jgi:hypothetical protein
VATHTLITAAATTLTAITYSESPTVLLPADLATVAQAILQDNNVPGGKTAANVGQAIPGAFSFTGVLVLPGGRGSVKLYPGDVIAVDNTGWPIVVSAHAIADATDWTFT